MPYLKNKALSCKSANCILRKHGVISVETLTCAQSPRKKQMRSEQTHTHTHTHTHTSIYYSINICYTQLCTNIQVGPKGLGQNQTKVWALISKHSQNPSKITEHAHLIFTCACTCKIHVSPKAAALHGPRAAALKKLSIFSSRKK